MTYAELVARINAAQSSAQIDRLISLLKDLNNHPYPKIEDFKKEYEPSTHDVFDKSKRKNKPIYKTVKNSTGDLETVSDGEEPVNRVSIPFQQSIVESRVNFSFGLPVKRQSDARTEPEKQLIAVLDSIFEANKIETVDREYAREAMRATLVAEYWFVQETDEKHKKYEIETKAKLRVMLWKPWEGNELYPYFDETGDLIAFSRGFSTMDENNEKILRFECYTKDYRYQWIKSNGLDWKEKEPPLENPINKIPVTFTKMDRTAWDIVQCPISRLETIVSNLGDTNDYHASPKIFVQGKVKSFMKKGEAGGIIQGEQGAKAEYLSWDRSPESMKLEVELLMRFIYGFSNMPDMSFEQMAKMTNPSGETMKMLFMAAHLQVLADSEKYNDWQDRRISIVKAFLPILFAGSPILSVTDLKVKPVITPFIIDDMTTKITNLTSANGGKALISQKTAMTLSTLVDNVDEEITQLEAEQDARDKRENDNFMKQNTAEFP